MKFSIVTISLNQADFLERAIRSVIDQQYPLLEYIVVDPGSADGSRQVIERYREKIARVIFESDVGPADGLNKGFSTATGDIFGFLNADDILLPGAIRSAADAFQKDPGLEVISGHSLIIDASGKTLRVSHSDAFSLRAVAYGSCVLMQPSTFFRRNAFRLTGGFNIDNRSNWDGELFIDMGLGGASFGLVDEIWSGFRVHSRSITGSKTMDTMIRLNNDLAFAKIIRRERNSFDKILSAVYRIRKYLLNPAALYQRLAFGPVYGNIPQR